MRSETWSLRCRLRRRNSLISRGNRGGGTRRGSAQLGGLENLQPLPQAECELKGLLFDVETNPDTYAFSGRILLLKPPAAIAGPAQDRRIHEEGGVVSRQFFAEFGGGFLPVALQ